MSNELKKLADARNGLLLAEVAALLHDVGKLSSQFIDQMSQTPSGSSEGFEHESAVERIPNFIDADFLAELKGRKLRDLLRWNQIASPEQIGQVLDVILHHDKPRHSALLVRLLNRCDCADSGADKGTTRIEGLPGQARQFLDATFIASAFGHETEKIDTAALDTTRSKMTSDSGDVLSSLSVVAARSPILEQVARAYRTALGETRRSANDVTLWDHSFSVSTLYKSALAQFVVAMNFDLEHLLWRILRVNFDVLGVYAKAIKIADLLGYKERIDLACEKVKHLIEEECPLGNEIYRDTTGIYFTFPDLALPDDLKHEIRRLIQDIEPELAPRIAVGESHGPNATAPLKHLLAGGRKEACKALAQPFERENLNPCWQSLWEKATNGKREVCPVCRLRPMEEHKDACVTCIKRRDSRIGTWLKNPSQTIWIDEIADHNDRVALIVGKFGLDDWLSGDLVQTMLVKAVENEPAACVPKNPSAARLRRVWETCRRFWTETVERDILAKYTCGACSKNPVLRTVRLAIQPQEKNGWHKNVAYDLTLNGQPISLLWDDSKGYFVTIINLQLSSGEAKSIEELQHAWPGTDVEGPDPINPRKRRRFTIQEVEQAQGDLSSYRPFLTLLTSPDEFLALVPASEALDLASKIRDEYQKQFSRVQDRLPLFLGLVFFLRKTPLMAVMDTARRMLATPLCIEQWTVKEVDNEKLSAEGWPDTVKVSLEKNGQQICFKIKTVMGDDTTEDVWYPYFFFEGDPGTRSRRFQLDGRWLVHVNDLHAGDPVSVTPSRFACPFLESTVQRFRFDPERGREVMLLDELPRLREMWKQICGSPDMSDTKLQAIHSLFEGKRQEWKPGDPTLTQPTIDETFRHLVETTLTHDKVQGVKPEDVLNGRFLGCLNLHLHILKRRVSDERKNKEAQNEPATI